MTAQTLKIRAEILGHFIKIAKVRHSLFFTVPSASAAWLLYLSLILFALCVLPWQQKYNPIILIKFSQTFINICIHIWIAFYILVIVFGTGVTITCVIRSSLNIKVSVGAFKNCLLTVSNFNDVRQVLIELKPSVLDQWEWVERLYRSGECLWHDCDPSQTQFTQLSICPTVRKAEPLHFLIIFKWR